MEAMDIDKSSVDCQNTDDQQIVGTTVFIKHEKCDVEYNLQFSYVDVNKVKQEEDLDDSCCDVNIEDELETDLQTANSTCFTTTTDALEVFTTERDLINVNTINNVSTNTSSSEPTGPEEGTACYDDCNKPVTKRTHAGQKSFVCNEKNLQGNEKRKRKVLSLDTKLRIIELFERGQSKVTIAKELNINEATIRSVLKKTNKYRDLSRSVSTSSINRCLRNRSPLMIEMEDLLVIWIEDCHQKGIPVSTKHITEKAISIFRCLKKTKYYEIDVSFTGSKGWFEKFKSRAANQNVKVIGEAKIVDETAASLYPNELMNIIQENDYDYRQIFNVDETGLYWKKMPSRTFLAKSEESQPGYKPSKERITLLLGGNAAGDFKLKPLLVNKSLNPRAFKNINKEKLPVIWKANKKGWITQTIFEDWFRSYFCPEVKKYCKKNNLAFKALLLLDNAPEIPQHLNNISNNVKVIFLPPNTTALLKPMDQGVFATFKAYYIRRVFGQAFDATTGDPVMLQQFWKKYNIKNAVENINFAWNEVTSNCMGGVWKKLLPENPTFESPVNKIINECVLIGNELGFQNVDAENVQELFVEYIALSTDDLMELESQMENIQNDKDEDDNEDDREKMISNEREGLFQDLERIKSRLMKIDSDINRITRKFNVLDKEFECYRVNNDKRQ